MDKRNFEFPSNVKQIGSIDDKIKVYVEDYAYRYICQYARAETHSEKVGALVGEYIEIEGQNVILISGFIQGKYSNASTIAEFTDDTWEYIRTRKERYYKNFEIVGWLHTQPGNGIVISDDDRKFHEEYFIEPYQLLFIMDSIEKLDVFFVWDNEQEKLRELNGYFIYYDKNDCMQEYMIDNKLVKSRSYDYREDNPPEKEDVIVNYRRLDRNRREEMHQKKVVNMLVGTSGIVVVLCFLMGLLLVQNSQRMTRLETELVSVTDVYKEITGRGKASNDGTALVFASQDESIEQAQSEPSKDEELEAIVKEAETQASTEAITATTTISTTEKATEATTQAQTQASTQKQTEAVTQKSEQTQAPPQQHVTSSNQSNIPDVHSVREGDSLSWISKHYYGTNKMISRIMEYNDIKDPDKVYIGMEIKLPKD